MRFSKLEIEHLVKAWLILSLAFGIVIGGFSLSAVLVKNIILSALTVGIGFLLHELAHKFVAQYYGCYAEFRASMQMLVLALIMSFFGFIFAAPGAVWISGHVNKKRNGIISVAGPITNIVLALLFMAIGLIPGILQINYVAEIIGYGIGINAFLALFNMIPFGLFDGLKVWRWNKPIFFIVTIIAFLLTMFAWSGI